MSNDVHIRAQQMISASRVEGLTAAEMSWLSEHLASCATCSEAAERVESAIGSIKSTSVSLPAGLAERTRFRVQLRAAELAERQPHQRALWIVGVASWAFGLISAPFVWRLFEWAGDRAGVPTLAWQAGFFVWWMIPTGLAAVVVLLDRAEKLKGENLRGLWQ